MTKVNTRLPIFGSAVDSLALIASNIGFLLGRGAIWMLAVIALQYYFDRWARTHGLTQTDGITPALAYNFANSFILIASLALFAVQWHRHVLGVSREGEGSMMATAAAYGAIAIAIDLLLTLAMYVPSLLVGEAPWQAWQIAATGVALLASWLLTARIGLLLPDVAVEGKGSMALAWDAGRGNTWRMVFGSLLAIVISFLPSLAVWWVVGIVMRPAGTTVAEAADGGAIENSIMALIGTVLGISYLSVAYRHLVMNRKEATV